MHMATLGRLPLRTRQIVEVDDGLLLQRWINRRALSRLGYANLVVEGG
jgi:hypothetical protein